MIRAKSKTYSQAAVKVLAVAAYLIALIWIIDQGLKYGF